MRKCDVANKQDTARFKGISAELLACIELDRLDADALHIIQGAASSDLKAVELRDYLTVVFALFGSKKFQEKLFKFAEFHYNIENQSELEWIFDHMLNGIIRRACDDGKQYEGFSWRFFLHEPNHNQLWTSLKALKKSIRPVDQSKLEGWEPTDTNVDVHLDAEYSEQLCRAMAIARRAILNAEGQERAKLLKWLTLALVDCRALTPSEIGAVIRSNDVSSIEAVLRMPFETWHNTPFALECNCLGVERPILPREDDPHWISWAAEILRQKTSTTKDRLCTVRKMFPGLSPRGSQAPGENEIVLESTAEQ